MTRSWRRPVMTAAMISMFVMTAAMISLLSVKTSSGASDDTFSARLTGFKAAPSINSPGTGQFQLTIDDDQLKYTLTYSGLTSDVLQAHVHFAQTGVNGGVAFFLCGVAASGLPAPLADTPPCPAGGGTVSGTITAADIIAIGTQNLAANDFASVVKIIRSGVGYVNVHTTDFPAGEIRGQVAND